MEFLPVSLDDAAKRGIDQFDFVIVGYDAYVDHPSFGSALIGRLLESKGFSVGMIARPDPDDVAAFRLCGKPRLAFLAGSGALDSMVCSYTANRKPRSEDEYAPGGRPELCLRSDGTIGIGVAGRKNARPDRALIAMVAKCREAYKGVPVIAGGLEASLRRFSHYDYWSDTVRRSVLLDSKADLLVYGMAETAMVEIARRLESEEPVSSIRDVRGTAWRCTKREELPTEAVELPSYEDVKGADPESLDAFAKSFALQYANTDAKSAKTLFERDAERFVVQNPPAFPLEREEFDRVYALPFVRDSHPAYAKSGGVPALAEVRFSITASRGCFGACAFCSLVFHQGRVPTSRSRESILDEAELLTRLPGFKGYIHDIGGPTANFRGPACDKMRERGACTDRRCLAPSPCPNLKPDHREFTGILKAVRSLPGVRKAFIRSGIRFDYAMLDKDDSFLRELVAHHVSGMLKVAPEHASDKVLKLMGKPPHASFDSFVRKYEALNRECGLDQYLVPYFIASHPGSTLDEAIELACYLRDTGFRPDQVQDFYPTPGTLATCMYRTHKDPLTGERVPIPSGDRERGMQRALLQFWKSENARVVKEALRLAGREDLIGSGPECLVR